MPKSDQCITCYFNTDQLCCLPILQERIAKAHGSQCGFCTPGFVMSMYALLRSNHTLSEEDIEEAFQGMCMSEAIPI